MSDFLPRISTLQSSLTRQRMTMHLNQNLATAEKEAATGMRADVFRQLGARSATSVSLRNEIDRNEAFVSSNRLLEGRLDATVMALSEVRDSGQEFLTLAIGSRDSKNATATELQAAARTALARVITGTNTHYKGNALFSGISSNAQALTPWNKNGPSGLSPQSVFAQIAGTGPTTNAEAVQIAAEFAQVFDNTHPDPARRFEGMFYGGAPATLPDGSANERVTARIDEGVTLDYGVQANDPAFADLLRGLSMIASVDVTQIDDPDAYKTFMSTAIDAVAGGLTGILAAETQLGSQQNLLERVTTGQEDMIAVYESRILDLEGVDPYEAATRLTHLQTQLQSSYAISARLANLSLLDFLR